MEKMQITKASKAASGRMSSSNIKIKFNGMDALNIGDIVSLEYDGRIRYFNITEVYAKDIVWLYYTAEEYGYYTIIKGDIDLRKLYDLYVELVTDETRLKELEQESRFC